jgi:hypothetical protein
MAAGMKVNKNLIARIWKEADLKPHRLERYMASNDPQFEEKARAQKRFLPCHEEVGVVLDASGHIANQSDTMKPEACVVAPETDMTSGIVF